MSLQVIGSSFRAVQIAGNPNLDPESATTYNAGVLVKTGPFTASVDYFRYDFSGPLESEPVSGVVNALFGASGTANCGQAAYAGLQSRFTFTGAGCGIANVQRLNLQVVNSADLTTSGIDAQANLRFELLDTRLQIGGSGTYVFEYKLDDVTVEGITVQPAFDAVGLLNYQTTAYPLPEIKGQAYFQADTDNASARLQLNYIGGYTDQRGATIFGPNAGALAGASVTDGKKIGAFKTVDITVRYTLPYFGGGTSVSLSAQNIFDEEPPFARLDQNYDPFTHSALGANVKLGISTQF